MLIKSLFTNYLWIAVRYTLILFCTNQSTVYGATLSFILLPVFYVDKCFSCLFGFWWCQIGINMTRFLFITNFGDFSYLFIQSRHRNKCIYVMQMPYLYIAYLWIHCGILLYFHILRVKLVPSSTKKNKYTLVQFQLGYFPGYFCQVKMVCIMLAKA